MEFLSNYGLFLAKVVTVVAALLVLIAAVMSQRGKHKSPDGEISLERLNESLKTMTERLKTQLVPDEQRKAAEKARKKAEKAERKRLKAARKAQSKHIGATPEQERQRVFVLDFDGDIKASDTANLTRKIDAVLAVADARQDEVVVRLESAGGLVHSYGLAAAQLDRLRTRGLKLTACVDKVAASGGYMMACVASHILASPFAVIGSIGVVAQLPNFHRLLKKHDIDYEVLTAGEFKRTLTIFGENTDKGREKFLSDLEDTHELFKTHVSERRPQLDIVAVANGDIWFGRRALEVELIDELKTSDDYLLEACERADVFVVNYEHKRSLQEKLGMATSNIVEKVTWRVLEELRNSRMHS